MSYSIEFQISCIFFWLLLVFLLHLSMVPLLRWIHEPFVTPVSFGTGLLSFTLVSWYCVHIGLPVQLAGFPFFLLLIWGGISQRITGATIRSGRIWYLIFVAFFMFTLIIKIFSNSSIDISFERFTDHMYLASMMLSPHTPPVDAWFSGNTLSGYYYLSQWPYAVLGIIARIPSVIVYHLIIPTVFGISALFLYATAILHLARYRSLIFAVLTLPYPFLLLSSYTIWQAGIPLINIVNSTIRVIPGSITENPLTALFIGSPRAYALGMVNQVFFIFLLCYAFRFWNTSGKTERIGYSALCIICLGSMFPMHSWDALVYGPLLLLAGALLCLSSEGNGRPEHTGKRRTLQEIAGSSLTKTLPWFWFVIPAGSVLLYLPYLFQMDTSGIRGIVWNPVPSDPLLFLFIHGFLLLVMYIYLRGDLRKNLLVIFFGLIPAFFGFISLSLAVIPLLVLVKRRFSSVLELLAATGLFLLIFCEVFSFVDSSGIDRMNTTYKLYFMAWFLLCIPVCIFISDGIRSRDDILQSPSSRTVCSVLVGVSVFIIPGAILLAGLPYCPEPTLDGMLWIEKAVMPEEYHALEFLKTLPPGEIVVEGVNTDQVDEDTVAKYYSRVSTFTGIPSVLGCYTREKVFRNLTSLDERAADIQTIYTRPEMAGRIMKKYGATLLITGYPEYSRYRFMDPGVYGAAGFRPVWNEGATVIWRPPS